jgi:hypothetical protein
MSSSTQQQQQQLEKKEGRYVCFQNSRDETLNLTMFGSQYIFRPSQKGFLFEFDRSCDDDDVDGHNNNNLQVLGGVRLPDDSNNNDGNQPDSIYRRLPRPLELPVSSGAVVEHLRSPDDARAAYDLLWTGNKVFLTLVLQDDIALFDIIIDPDAHVVQSEAFKGTVMYYAAPRGPAGQHRAYDFGGHSTSPFWDILNEPQRDAILRRVLHRWLRLFGFSVPFDLVVNVRSFLIGQYLSARNYKEALDAAVIAADIAVNKKSNNQDEGFDAEKACSALGVVAEILEACGKISDAASLYREIAHDWASVGSSGASLWYHKAGTAFQLCEEYDLAENNFVSALSHSHAGNDSWDVNAAGVQKLFKGILSLYWCKPTGTSAAIQPGKSEQSLLALLLSDGYDFRQAGIEELLPIALLCKECLLPRINSSDRAKDSLAIATETSDTQEFRSNLSSFWNPDVAALVMEPVSSPPLSDRVNRRAPRDFLLEPRRAAQHFRLCFGPGCRMMEWTHGSRLRSCPCQTVYYCSKQCQRLHWQQHHKRNCPRNADTGTAAAELPGSSSV